MTTMDDNNLSGKHVNVAMMTSGGLAPCLSSSVSRLAHYWIEAYKSGKIAGLTLRMYKDGYKGVLIGESFIVPEGDWPSMEHLDFIGGSPIGNSRVKLTNEADCKKRGFIKEDETALEVAAQRLIADEVHVLHTIGGDDTNTQAAHLSKYILEQHGGKVVVVGMPKTIDNDVFPIRQTFGADTAAKEGSKFFANVVSESSANPNMLVLHEVMGRDCGYLTAKTASYYMEWLAEQKFASEIFPSSKASREIHAIWIPEIKLDLKAEAIRLKEIMNKYGCVNIFFGEGTGVSEIVKDMESRGEEVPRDAFGHVSLAKINPGQYFAKNLSEAIGAEKTIVQKSGYFARSAAANDFDRKLIGDCAKVGVESAINGTSGCMGQDEDKEGMPIRAIEFERIKGGKPFDISEEWFQKLLGQIGQTEK